jgi:hypothetical protein
MRQTWLDMRLIAGPAWTDSTTEMTGLIPNNFSPPTPETVRNTGYSWFMRHKTLAN